MKKVKSLFICLMLFSAAINISSCRIEGCTCSKADNYNDKASKDDGSCTYDHVTFWAWRPQDNFPCTVYFDNNKIGTVSAASNSANCGIPGPDFVNITLPDGNVHSFYVTDNTGTILISGNIQSNTYMNNSCISQSTFGCDLISF